MGRGTVYGMSKGNSQRVERYPIRSIRMDDEVYGALRSVAVIYGSPNKAFRALLIQMAGDSDHRQPLMTTDSTEHTRSLAPQTVDG